MVKTRNFLVLGLGIASMALVGCSGIDPLTRDDVDYESQKVEEETFFANNISVRTDGFLETDRRLYSGDMKSNLNNLEARKAIEASLDSAGMFNNNGEYLLDVKLADAGESNFLENDDKSLDRQVRIEFDLINQVDEERITRDLVVGNGKKRTGKMFKDMSNEEYLMSKMAYQDAIKKLIDKVKILNYMVSTKEIDN